MGRYLLGVVALTMGLVALASVTRNTRSSETRTAAAADDHSGKRETLVISGEPPYTLFLPAPAFDLQFSLN
jgi:hypothetical protein